MKNKTTLNRIGLYFGLVVIAFGIFTMCTPAMSFPTDSVRSHQFGADYYTEQYEASRAAVTNTAVTANNLRELGHKEAMYFGVAFIVAGVVISLEYQKKIIEEEEKVEATAFEEKKVEEKKLENELPEL